jgi:hypothetical protein
MTQSSFLQLPYEILHLILWDVFRPTSSPKSSSLDLAPYPLHQSEKTDIFPYLLLCKRVLPLIEEFLYVHVFVPASQLELFFQCAMSEITSRVTRRGRFTRTLSVYEYHGASIRGSQMLAACPQLCQLRVDGTTASIFCDEPMPSLRCLYIGSAYFEWRHLQGIAQHFPRLQSLRIHSWTGLEFPSGPICLSTLLHLSVCANFISLVHPSYIKLPSLTVLSCEIPQNNPQLIEGYASFHGKGIHTLDLHDRMLKGGRGGIFLPNRLLQYCPKATTVILSYPVTDPFQYYIRSLDLDSLIIPNLAHLILTNFTEHSDPRHLKDCAQHFTRERYPGLTSLTATFSPWCNPAAMRHFLYVARPLFPVEFDIQATYDRDIGLVQ